MSRPWRRSGGLTLFIPTAVPVRAVGAVGAVGARRTTCSATPPPRRPPPPARKEDGEEGASRSSASARSGSGGAAGSGGRPAPFGSEIGPTTGVAKTSRRRRRGNRGVEDVDDAGTFGRKETGESVDIDRLPSVPLVRKDVSPESGEDYWMELGSATQAQMRESKRGKADIDDGLKQRLKDEVVSPYTQNWILRIAIVVAVLAVLVAVFGGPDSVPIISVPDL